MNNCSWKAGAGAAELLFQKIVQKLLKRMHNNASRKHRHKFLSVLFRRITFQNANNLLKGVKL
jgi:hypothetical protein